MFVGLQDVVDREQVENKEFESALGPIGLSSDDTNPPLDATKNRCALDPTPMISVNMVAPQRGEPACPTVGSGPGRHPLRRIPPSICRAKKEGCTVNP